MISKRLLSGSVNGTGILLENTPSTPTLIHTVAIAPTIDEIWIWAVNTTGTQQTATFFFGSVNAGKDKIVITLEPNEGLVTVVPGLPLTAGVTVNAFCGNSNAVNVFGYVNRLAA
jgi:hypothetical protein